jgi:hypothetical protein
MHLPVWKLWSGATEDKLIDSDADLIAIGQHISCIVS